jgi:hypothetical protein
MCLESVLLEQSTQELEDILIVINNGYDNIGIVVFHGASPGFSTARTQDRMPLALSHTERKTHAIRTTPVNSCNQMTF